MKSKEGSNALKEKVETVSRKLHELTEEELAQVSGGRPPASIPSIVVATAPVLLKIYDQANKDPIVTNFEPDPKASDPAGLPQ